MARVLRVEHDDVVRGAVAAHLRRAAHLVLDVGSAQGALDAIVERSAAPDVAVLDMELPDMEGVELVTRCASTPDGGSAGPLPVGTRVCGGRPLHRNAGVP